MTGEALLGLGLYTIPEAARFIGVPAPKLKRWALGYTFTFDGAKRFSEPVIARERAELAREGILTFADMIELKLVSMFREHGLSMQYIRSAARFLSEKFHTAYPLATKRFHTDGKHLFLEMEREFEVQDGVPRSMVLEQLPCAQLVMGELALPFFKKLDYEAGMVFRYWPLGREKGVVLDPKRAFGKPIDNSSGVPTFVLYQMALAGEQVESIAQWYEISSGAVKSAIEYEESLLAA